MDICRIALTPASSLCQSAQRLSFVHHVTFAECWKSHLTPFKVELCFSPVIVLPFAPFPMAWVCPHISWLQTLSLRSNSQSADPSLGHPLKLLMTPFVWGESSSSSPLASPTPAVCSYFTVITLPLVPYLNDLKCLKGGGLLNLHCRLVSVVGEQCRSCSVGNR